MKEIIHCFQLLPTTESDVRQTIKLFLNAGWVHSSKQNAGNVVFIYLRWPLHLGDPVYPEGHQPNKAD